MKIAQINESNRKKWIEKTIRAIPESSRILDAGAGEQQFKVFCSHLRYVSQDFGKYEGTGDSKGLQTGTWDQASLDIVCDIVNIPEPDDSFDAIMCIEVFEHLPNPIAAIQEFSRLLKAGGTLILTAPFCSLTHFSPFHFYSGFNWNFYKTHLESAGFQIIEIVPNGNFFEFLRQEINRIPSVSFQYSRCRPTLLQRLSMQVILKMLKRFSCLDSGSDKLLCFGYHVLARRL